jgi:CubicO group peptidase (beta-lactamase class C family)
MRLNWTACLCIACALVSPVRPSNADELDSGMQKVLQQDHIPGMALLVVRGGVVLKAGMYGFANVEHRIPVKRTTMFQSGSLGKQFTAAAVLLLVDRGRLSLDDRIDKYLPAGPAGWEKITIRELLDHTSGIHDSEEDGEVFDLRHEYTDDEIIRIAHDLPCDFQPGTAWKYNNMGYILAGIIVTRVTGMFYGDFLRQEFFAPLGMRTARIISDSDIVMDRAAGYLRTANGVRNQDFVSAALNATADGSLYLSLNDWAAWIRGLDRRAILSRASYGLLWGRGSLRDGTAFDHGFGWDMAVLDGRPVLEFDGSWQGFRSAIERDPATQTTVVVLANLAEAKPEEAARAALRAALAHWPVRRP